LHHTSYTIPSDERRQSRQAEFALKCGIIGGFLGDRFSPSFHTVQTCLSSYKSRTVAGIMVDIYEMGEVKNHELNLETIYLPGRVPYLNQNRSLRLGWAGGRNRAKDAYSENFYLKSRFDFYSVDYSAPRTKVHCHSTFTKSLQRASTI
jgi:hypothetical protein